MKISLNWLKDFIQLGESAEEIAEKLTFAGLEVEHIENHEQVKGSLAGVVIGEVITCEKHPEADKLSITTVDIGNSTIVPIVCGASNVGKGQKVLVATINTTLYPTTGEPITIKKAKIRGQVSEGMICAEDELGLGTSHEGIMVLNTDLPNGTPAIQYLDIAQDTVIEIGLTPNRADAASHLGVARDLKALFKREIQLPVIGHFKIDNQKYPIEVIVENQLACPRYAGLTISNITVKSSPEWLQNRLKAIGLAPINNIVDITNYVQHTLGQPQHAFDADKITTKKVVVKTLPKDTPFVTLDKQSRKLSENDLIICNGDKEPMCIAGVFGGLDSGVSETTKNIFLESAYFSPDYVRKTSLYHGLKTDASFRYERGTDPNMPLFALKYAAMLIKEIAGGEISSEITDIYPNPVRNFEIEVDYANIHRLIGKKIENARIHEILNDLDIQILDKNEEGFRVSVPPYRVDVQREADIIEEILRIYGFNNVAVPAQNGTDYLADFPATDANKIQFKVAQLLAGNGFYEIITNSLTKPAYAETLKNIDVTENVVILNKLSEDLEVMRQSLIFSGLEVIGYNLNRKQKDLKLFEFGRTYHKILNPKGDHIQQKYTEKNFLALFITGNQQAESWRVANKQTDFYDLNTAVQKVLQRMNCTKYEINEVEKTIFSNGLQYVQNQKIIGQVGLLQNYILKKADLKHPVFYAELDWDYLLKHYQKQFVYEEISKFPEVRRDLSLILDKKITFQQIKELTFSKEKNLLRQMNVFDVYEGENIGADKKSYSISFILLDNNQTLTDKVIDKTMEKLMQVYEKELGAVIRK